MSRNKQIVCISYQYWDDPWYRKQHFMYRFVQKGYKVAYIEPSFSMVRRPESYKKEYAINRYFKVIVQQINKNLFIIKPPRYLPYWTKPYISKFNFLYLSIQVSFILKKLGFKEYILWIYRPECANALRIFKYRKLIFDITDDLAAYGYNNRSKYLYKRKCMEYLTKQSDLVFVTASTLFEKFKKFSSNIYLVSNGYDSTLFTERNAFPIPLDMKEIPTPIIGFVGTIFSFLDFELIKYIVKNNQDKSFVFIGNYEFNIKREWLSLVENYKNIFWLGKKKKEEIPKYISEFNVCINPFKIDEVSKSVSPLKVFEYLAMKKPVVSVRMESLEKEKVAPYIYFASSHKDFNKELNIALKEKDRFEKKLDYEKIKGYSWDNLFRKVLELTKDL